MSSKKGFFSENKDLLNAAGHAINTLQNHKIKKTQKDIAQLSLINAALQEENSQINRKSLELLEQQQEQYEEKKKIEKQQKHIKTLMFKTAPELEKLTASLNEVDEGEKQVQSFLDSRYMLKFLELNRGLVENLDFQRLIIDQKELIELYEKNNSLDKEFLARSTFNVLKENSDYLKSLNILKESRNKDLKLNLDDIDTYRNVSLEIHQDPVRASIITEVLSIIKKKSVRLDEIEFEDEFLDFAIQTTENITDIDYFKSKISDPFSHLKEVNTPSEAELDFEKRLDDEITNILKEKESLLINLYIQDRLIIQILNTNESESELIFGLYLNFCGGDKYTDNLHFKFKDSRFYKKYEPQPLEGDDVIRCYMYYTDSKEKLINETKEILTGCFEENLYSVEIEDFSEVKPLCFVVTAATGSTENYIVRDFRKYRDQKLNKTYPGQLFISIYYKVGPYLAEIIRRYPTIRTFVLKRIIKPLHKLIKK